MNSVPEDSLRSNACVTTLASEPPGTATLPSGPTAALESEIPHPNSKIEVAAAATVDALARCRICKKEWPVKAIKFPMMRNPLVPNLCDQCDEDRKQLEEEKGRALAAAARAELAERREKEWAKFCPEIYRLTTESGGRTEIAKLELANPKLKMILAWKFGPQGLILRSRASGKAKTRSIWRLLRREFLNHRTIAAYTATGFHLRAQDAAGNFNASSWMANLCSVDILYIDDLGKGNWTENTEAIFFEVVEHRTSHGKPIFASTNYDWENLLRFSRSETAAYTIRRLREFCALVEIN